jgi:hypothetical protein
MKNVGYEAGAPPAAEALSLAGAGLISNIFHISSRIRPPALQVGQLEREPQRRVGDRRARPSIASPRILDDRVMVLDRIRPPALQVVMLL